MSTVLRFPRWAYALVYGLLSSSLMAADHPQVPLPEGVALSDVSAEVCGQCHTQIYEQWSGSMHAKSTALKDPIHNAFYRAVVGDPLAEGVRKGPKKKYPVCLQCHAPAAAKAGKTKLDAKPAYAEGVNCVACHSLETFKGVKASDGKLRLGIKAYTYSDTKLFGPGRHRTPKASNGTAPTDTMHVAPVLNNPQLLRTNAACLGCHDQRPNGNGVPLCVTGDEIRTAGGSTTCQSCHMPVVDGVVSHAMPGGHSAAMVGSGLAMRVQTEAAGDKLATTVELTNTTPHNFPTGAPFRNVTLSIKAYDKAGKVLWQNAKGHPGKSDPQAFLFYALGDQHGNPAPPPKATQVLSDSRLKPNEQRTLSYEIPAQGVAVVRVEAYYNLLLPGVIKKFGAQLPDEAKAPKLVATAEARL